MSLQGDTGVVDYGALADGELAARAADGDREAFRAVMQQCNQRLFRVARGVLHDDFEAEDVVQEAYVRAFQHIGAFRAQASLLTWLTRIVLNEANGRLRKRRLQVGVEYIDAARAEHSREGVADGSGNEDPSVAAARAEIRRLVEQAVDELPDDFRLVFVLRDIEHCSVAETAAQLGLREATVKTRLFRARRQLRTALRGTLANAMDGAFPFLGARCARMTETVLRRLSRPAPENDTPTDLPELAVFAGKVGIVPTKTDFTGD